MFHPDSDFVCRTEEVGFRKLTGDEHTFQVSNYKQAITKHQLTSLPGAHKNVLHTMEPSMYGTYVVLYDIPTNVC